MSILLLNCNHTDPNNIAQWLQFFAILVAILSFWGNIVWQEHVRKRDILERLNNEIFATCEKEIRYIFQANASILAARYHYALLGLGENDKEEQGRFYLSFYDKGQATNEQIKILEVDLVKNIQDYKKYGKEKHYNEIRMLLSEKHVYYMNEWSSFRNLKTKAEIVREYEIQGRNIRKFMFSQTTCKNLRKIEKIVHPDYPLWETMNEFEDSDNSNSNQEKQ